MDNDYEGNRKAWDTWAEAHFGSEFYDVRGFLEGRNTLRPIEREALGDVAGKSLLHLQCHFGMDTLSWARLGADVTGVDFSPTAMELAQRLAADANLSARFVCSSVEELPESLSGSFDLVFTSYGVLPWLRDLRRWAEVIVHFLRPGGTFLLVDTHPTLHLFANDESVADWRLFHPYFENAGPIREVCERSYASAAVPAMELTEWPHSMSEIVNSLIDAGLTIRSLTEYPHCFYRCSPLVERREDGNWWPKDPVARLPLTLAVQATR